MDLVEFLKGIKPIADVGITGTVAAIALWVAIKKDGDVRRIEKEKLAIEREKLGLVQAAEKEKTLIMREAYERAIAAAEKQGEQLAAFSAEQSRTIAALTEAVQIEEEIESKTADLRPMITAGKEP